MNSAGLTDSPDSVNGAESSEAKIAVIGDSRANVERLKAMLRDAGSALYNGNCTEAMQGSTTPRPDLILIDIQALASVEQTNRKLRQYHAVCKAPVLCVLALSDEPNPRSLAQLGVEDFLLKPFRPIELAGRIEVLLAKFAVREDVPLIERRRGERRQRDAGHAHPTPPKQRCVIDDQRKSVTLEGRPLHLSPREYKLFRLLASKVGKIFSIQDIVSHAWPGVNRATASDVHQYMHLLRRKVEKDPAQPRWILTEKGFGYKLVIPAEPETET